MLIPEKLYEINKTNQDIIQLLSPEINITNQELFYKKSSDQDVFTKELRNRGIEASKKEKYPELEDCIGKCWQQLEKLLKENKEVRRTRLDFDIAKIFHQNFSIPMRATINYEFWRYITLFYFIKLVKWRWENNPEDPSKWYSNAKTICGRALGITLNKRKYDEDKSIDYTVRNRRIDIYRYWWIGNKLFDPNKQYYYIDKISEKYKEDDASLQDFINHLEGNRLLSENNRVSKIMAESILLSSKKFSESEMRLCFNRYNAYCNRLFMEAEPKLIKKEICLLDV
jgi:hypothetical protein